jgi:hypothetical protein
MAFMKRILLICALGILMIAQPLFSQIKPFRFGLKIGPTIGWMSPDTEGYEKDGSAAGFNWGFISDFTITDNYYFATGFSINYMNSKLMYDTQLQLNNDTASTAGTLARRYKLRYIDVPLSLKMKTNQFNDIQFFGQIGFNVGLNIKANSEDNFTYAGGSQEMEKDLSDDITFLRGALILGAGIEYYIDHSTSIIAGVTFSNGISNVLKGNNPLTQNRQKAVPNYFELTLGIIF